MAEGIDLLEEQRRLMFEKIAQLQGFYNTPQAQQFNQQLQARASGTDSPFTQNVVNNQLADNASAGAGQVRGQDQMINRAFANAGLSGSGLQASAMANARSRIGAQTRAGRRDITSRATLQNFQARERAQGQLQSYLQQQQQLQQRVTDMEVNLRSQMHATGDAKNVAEATATPQQEAVQAAAPSPAAAAPGPAPAPDPGPMPQRSVVQAPVRSIQDTTQMGAFGTFPSAFMQQQASSNWDNKMNLYRQQQDQADRDYQMRMAAWYQAGGRA